MRDVARSHEGDARERKRACVARRRPIRGVVHGNVLAVEERVARVIDEVIRPLVEADGGRIELVAVDAQVIVVRLSGACAGCPGAPYTTSRVIEPLLRAAAGHDVAVRVERAAPRPV